MNYSENSVGRFYESWEIYNERIVEVARDLSAEQLAVRPSPERWPMWATFGHIAGARVYWLCGVFGEPGNRDNAVSGSTERDRMGGRPRYPSNRR